MFTFRRYFTTLLFALMALAFMRVPVAAMQTDASWRGEYFANRNLSGAATLVRQDGVIDFDWGAGSPANGVPTDNFSARWSRNVQFDGGRYRFHIESDDGMRVFLDGNLIFEGWGEHAATPYDVDLNVSSGVHGLRVEYFEATGNAVARFWWQRLDGGTPTPNAWLGQYFGNTTLVGEPMLTRNDSAIAFNWGTGSPAPGLPADYFSVRWTRSIWFEAGKWRFTTETDDGVRLYVDGRLVIDKWIAQAATPYSVVLDLPRGQHDIRMEYFENTGNASARLNWQQADAPTPNGAWRGEYFANRNLSGAPALVRNDDAINFNWGTGAPAPGLPADNFSVRWTRSLNFDQGKYRFTTETDDGVRLYIDGRLVIDQWHDSAAQKYTADVDLTKGTHAIRMEYYEGVGEAVAKLSWKLAQKPTPPPTKAWLGEYFNNVNLSGAPALVREDANIKFDWGLGSPAPQVRSDYFSARWTRAMQFEGGRYRFVVASDDGVRLYIDGNLIINEWRRQNVSEFTRVVTLSKGQHTIVAEYFEDVGQARIDVRWEGPLQVPQRGNLITCSYPGYSWVKAYQLSGNNSWQDVNPRGWTSISASGRIKIDGLPVDYYRFGDQGQPYKVELWVNNQLVQVVGDILHGQPEFRIRPNADNYTPWSCPAR